MSRPAAPATTAKTKMDRAADFLLCVHGPPILGAGGEGLGATQPQQQAASAAHRLAALPLLEAATEELPASGRGVFPDAVLDVPLSRAARGPSLAPIRRAPPGSMPREPETTTTTTATATMTTMTTTTTTTTTTQQEST